jgi:hypothetical protein
LSEKFCFLFILDKGCPDPDPKLFILDPTPDPAKSYGSDRIRIQISIHKSDGNHHPQKFVISGEDGIFVLKSKIFLKKTSKKLSLKEQIQNKRF